MLYSEDPRKVRNPIPRMIYVKRSLVSVPPKIITAASTTKTTINIRLLSAFII
jgi:hypothetical protein